MSRFAIRSSLAALSLAMAATGLSATAVAAPDADGARHEQRQHRSGKHGHHHAGMKMQGEFMIPGVGPLTKKQIEALKLDAKQQAAFDAARDAQRELRKSMRSTGGQRHELLKAQLASGKLDPHALAARQDESKGQFREQAVQVRGKWLAAWDTLNDAQRQQVTELVKARQAKMQERRAKLKEGQDGKTAPAPAQAPAN